MVHRILKCLLTAAIRVALDFTRARGLNLYVDGRAIWSPRVEVGE